MKKVLVLLLLVVVTFAANAQKKESFRKYQISRKGYSNGLVIPSGFIIEFTGEYKTAIKGNKLKLEMESITYTDTLLIYPVVNDSIPYNLVFKIGKNHRDTTDYTGKFIRKELNRIYGKNNVIEIIN